MITIKKTKAGYHVVITGNNNEVLCTSEVLKTKAAAFKNVLATAKNYTQTGMVYFYEIDETKKIKIKYCWDLRYNTKNLVSANDL